MTGIYEKLLGAADKNHIKAGEEMKRNLLQLLRPVSRRMRHASF